MKLVALVTILAQGITSLLGAFHEKRLIYQGGEDPGDPLYLSPYILDGQINQGSQSFTTNTTFGAAVTQLAISAYQDMS